MKNVVSVFLVQLCLIVFTESRVSGQPTVVSKEAAMQSAIDGPSLGVLRSRAASPILTSKMGIHSDSALPSGVYNVGRMGRFPTIDSAFSKLMRDGVLGAVTLVLIDTLYQAQRGRRFELGEIAGVGPAARVTIRPAVNTVVTIRGDSDAVLYFQNTKYLTLDGRSNPPSSSAGITVHALYNPAAVWNDCIDAWGDVDRNEFHSLNLKSDDFRNVSPGGGVCLFLSKLGTSIVPDSNVIEGNLMSGVQGVYLSGYGTSPITRPRGNIIRGNTYGQIADLHGARGIQSEVCEGTLIEGNTVQFMRGSHQTTNNGRIWTIGINAYADLNTTIRNNVVHSVYASNGAELYGILGSGGTGGTGTGLLIHNNMVYDLQNTSTTGNACIEGICLWSNVNSQIYYNTVYLSGTGALPVGVDALCLYSTVTNTTLRNNIFVNIYQQTIGVASTAMWVNGAFTSDYNDFEVESSFANSYTAHLGTVNYRTLSAWQVTGYDQHSVTELPHFREPHLHIDSTFATWLNGRATPIAGITTDFDGQPRNALTPDIGADEFAGFVATVRRVPAQYATIQSAINASSHGDTVLVSDGTYYENIRFNGKKIVVASTFIITNDTSHISRTMINGSRSTHPDSGSVVYFISGEDTNSVLAGFTITGGTGTIDRVTFPGYASRLGGGIFCHAGARILCNNIEYNSINYSDLVSGAGGTGIWCGLNDGAYLIIERNRINNNTTATRNQSAGGGIGCAALSWKNMTVRIQNNTITNNSISSTTAGSSNNTLGGGLIIQYGNFIVTKNLISGNMASSLSTNDVNVGGGMHAYGTNVQFRENIVTGNQVQGPSNISSYGGGASFWAGGAQRQPLVANNIISLNKAIGGNLGGGGGIIAFDEAARIENNIIVKNTAYSGGGVGCARVNLAASDKPTNGGGGAMLGTLAVPISSLSSPGAVVEPPVLINNTIAYNRATSSYGGGIGTRGNWIPKVINSIVWGDTALQEIYVISGGIRVLYSNVTNGWPSDSGNISVYPQFADSTYRLANTSGCLERGVDSTQIDGTWYKVPPYCIYGVSRPTPAGRRPDIGACENPNSATDVDGNQLVLPLHFVLEQNYPNPFNPTTEIRYQIPLVGYVTLKVFDLLGREVATLVDEVQDAGFKSVQWNASGVASGVYFYRLQAGSFIDTKKCLVLR